MILLVDAGNSRIKLGWLDPATGGREPAALALAHAELRGAGAAPLAERLADLLAPWLAGIPGRGRTTRALGVNVAGDTLGGALQAALARHGCRLAWHRPGPSDLGVANGYAQPSQLGADRWAALLGLRAHLPAGHGPALLASFGTATTIDTLGPGDDFPGGLILPGPALMLASLAQGTANLPLAGGAAADFPVDTMQAIATGVAAAQAGAVLRQWLAGVRRYGQAPAAYATGGGWSDVAGETRRLLQEAAAAHGMAPGLAEVRELPHPVLDGLAALAGAAPGAD